MVQRQRDTQNYQMRVYKYGMVIKGTLPEQAIDELYKSNALWNRLVELHNENWQAIEEKRCEASPEYKQSFEAAKQLKEQIDSAYDHKRSLRVETGSMSRFDPTIEIADQKIEELKKQRKEHWKTHKKIRAKADKLFDLKDMNDKRKTAFKQAVNVKNSGIRNETADEVRKDFDNARDRILNKPGSGRLRFHRFDGTGYWHYRLRASDGRRNGAKLPLLKLANRKITNSFVFLSEDDSRKKPRWLLQAKLAGGATKLSKIFQLFDVIYHRPIPDEAIIQNGKILRTRTGDKFRYDLVLTVKLPLPQKPQAPLAQAIGVDIGFRQSEQDKLIRAFVMASVDGSYIKEVILPKKMQDAFNHIDDRKGLLDETAADLGNIIKPLLQEMPEVIAWKEQRASGEDRRVPTDPQEKIKHYMINHCAAIAYAKRNVTLSFERAYKIARTLLHHPHLLPEDVEKAILKWWRGHSRCYRELHNLRAKQLRHRNDYYRQVASELVSQKSLIAVEAKFLAKIAETREKNNELKKKARSNRVLAAPHMMISAIRNAADREGVPFIEVNPWNTSKTCFECGAINKALKSEIEWRCQQCGTIHDRDINAARNIAKKGQKIYFEQQNQSQK